MKKWTELNIDKIKVEQNDINNGLDSDDYIANFFEILSPFVNNFSTFFVILFDLI